MIQDMLIQEQPPKMPCSICRQAGHNKLKCPGASGKATGGAGTKAASPVAPDIDHLVSSLETLHLETVSIVDKVHAYIMSIDPNPDIILLKNKEVIQWLFGDLSFLGEIEKKNKTSDEAKYKILEDKWGQETLRVRRPDLTLDKQWTNKFGEHIVEELYTLQGKIVTKPAKKEHYQPDSEVDDAILEAKAGTFYTSGTAGEKILGCPFKYAEIPDLYEKPLKIVCMGGAERVCREQYGNLDGPKCTPQKKKFLIFFKEMKIEYVAASDILCSIVGVKAPTN